VKKISEQKVYLKAKKINQWDWPPVNLYDASAMLKPVFRKMLAREKYWLGRSKSGLH
jgi:hypothetical protein